MRAAFAGGGGLLGSPYRLEGDERARTMKVLPFAGILAGVFLLASPAVPVLAQQAENPPLTMPSSPSPDPYVNSLGPDTPQAQTGELVPLPGPPPEGKDAQIKLPDCAPPNCGTPQIMAP